MRVEASNESDNVIRHIDGVHVRLDVMDERLEEMESQFEEIKEQLQKIFWFIEFHLGEVPLKHRKFNPKKGEYPYFTTKNKNIPEFNKMSALEIPKDSEVLQTAKDRMLKLSEKANAEGVWNKWKGRPKLGSSEASSVSSEQQDSHQAHKQNESSLSSQESPDHNNPPSQT